jgi:hypothetical protein
VMVASSTCMSGAAYSACRAVAESALLRDGGSPWLEISLLLPLLLLLLWRMLWVIIISNGHITQAQAECRIGYNTSSNFHKASLVNAMSVTGDHTECTDAVGLIDSPAQ